MNVNEQEFEQLIAGGIRRSRGPWQWRATRTLVRSVVVAGLVVAVAWGANWKYQEWQKWQEVKRVVLGDAAVRDFSRASSAIVNEAKADTAEMEAGIFPTPEQRDLRAIRRDVSALVKK